MLKSWITIWRGIMGERNIKIEHPGVILKEEFMAPYGVSVDKLAKETGIDEVALNGILKGVRDIAPAFGLKLSKFFGMSERFWINLQADHDTRKAKIRIAEDLGKIQTLSKVLAA